MWRPLDSLKWRLGLWVFLPVIVISGIDLVITYRSTERTATLVQQQLLKGSAHIISEQISSVEGEYELSIPPAALELFASSYRDLVFYAVRSKEGKLIAGDGDLMAFAGKLQLDKEEYFLSTMRGEPVRVIAYAQSLPNQSAAEFAITEVGQTLRGHDAFRRELFLQSAREHLLILCVVVLALVVTLRWTLRPLSAFRNTLMQRRPGSLEALDEHAGPVELRPLAKSINDYVGRLDRVLSSYGQFVANTAHQLRTSFAIISSQLNFAQRSPGLDATQREVLQAIQRSVLHGTKVINQLLMLASVERDKQRAEELPPVQFALPLMAALDGLAPLAQQRHVDLGVDEVDESIVVAGHAHLLRELVSNLVDNAIQHGGEHGVVTVSLRRQGDEAWLTIVDNGPGIPTALYAKVFDRFYRLDDDKPNSSGLGLAIVKEICDTLQARIELSASTSGRGLRVDVILPVRPA